MAGWRSMELGEFFCGGEEDGELEVICCEIDNYGKSGIINRNQIDKRFKFYSVFDFTLIGIDWYWWRMNHVMVCFIVLTAWVV